VTCFSPLKGYRNGDGSVSFHSRVSGDAPPVVVACGQCRGCRRDRSCHWATRCLHEAALYPLNCFVTLTYEKAPVSLHYPDFQLFMRYLRRAREERVRFFMCGEYGEGLGRPHYHALLFNCDFPDRKYFKSAGGHRLYISDELSRLWPHGHSLVGGVSFQSAAYVARYCLKKVNGPRAAEHYVDVSTGEVRVSEFCHMSLKPGIGAGWMDRFADEVYPEGKVVVNGVSRPAPKYYDQRFKRLFPDDHAELVRKRLLARYDGSMLEHSDRRLAVRAKVADARDAFFSRRSLEVPK